MPETQINKNLIKKLIQGDPLSFEEIFKEYNHKIYTFSYRYLKNKEDAEGIVQEVFLKLWENSKKLKKDSNLNAWLFTVTFNAIRKRFRKMAAEKKCLEDYLVVNKRSKEEISSIEYYDLVGKVAYLIDKLPPQQKKIFLLRKETDMSCAEMAGKLKLSKKTVENHLNRARVFLKKSMMEDGLISILFYWMFLG